MSQKRMFDRAIIDTDRFMDLPVSAKALYFLLGMEADDEGFVSYKKVLRIHGGSEDDAKILVAKNFLISFPSGVVVITDWNTNNWLDNRRIKSTEYQAEKKLIVLTDNKKYELSTRSASIEEYRVEESSIEESNANQQILEFKDDVTVNREQEADASPSQIAKDFFNNPESEYILKVITWLTEKGYNESIVKKELSKFISYWTEKNKSGKKQRWELKETFEVNRRLVTWFGKFNSNNLFSNQGRQAVDLDNI